MALSRGTFRGKKGCRNKSFRFAKNQTDRWLRRQWKLHQEVVPRGTKGYAT